MSRLSLVLLLACACSRESDVGVKISRQMTMPLTAGDAAGLSAQDLATLTGIGVTLKDTTLVFPELMLAGYWVELGGQRAMLDDNAVALLHGGHDATATVYEDFGSTNPIGSFKLGDAAGKPWPVPIVLTTVLPEPGDMDADPLAKMHPPVPLMPQSDLSHCTQRDVSMCGPGDNSPMGCCLDYDNPGGDGVAYVAHVAADCDSQKIKNYIASTCFAWTAASACVDEIAFNRGPHCWDHHKWRNCQNLSLTDFKGTVVGPLLVQPGQTTTIKLRNNLPANDSLAIISAPLEKPGTLSAAGGAKVIGVGNNNFIVQHYDDGQRKHFEDAILTYTAPARADLPAVCDKIDVDLVFAARTFEPLDGALGFATNLVVPQAPMIQRDSVKVQIACNQTAPNLHLHWQFANNVVPPNTSTDLFDISAEIDLAPANMDPNVVTYTPTGGSVSATWVPYDPSTGDRCGYSATSDPIMLPPPPPAFLSISTKKPGILSSVGSAPTTVYLSKTCPDPMGGPDITDITTSMELFPVMNLMGGPTGVLSGSLEELRNGGLGGTVPLADGTSITYTLTAQ